MKRLRKNSTLFLLDLALLAIAPFLLYTLRFEGLDWGADHTRTAIVYALTVVPVQLLIFFAFGLYRRLWRYASIAELELIFLAGLIASVVKLIIGAVILPRTGLVDVRVPLSVLFTSGVLTIGIIAAPRMLIRIGGWRMLKRRLEGPHKRVLIVGAGGAGQMIAREISDRSTIQMKAVAFVDDDRAKLGMTIGRIPIVGTLGDLASVVKKYQVDEVVIALPSASGAVVRRVIRSALDAGVKTRTVPALSEILSGKLQIGALRDVEIQDLLRREPIITNLTNVHTLARGRTTLVTGAGGSIGSELCRQLAELQPGRLILLGHGENSIFEIHNELQRTFPDLIMIPVIADVRDYGRILKVFEEFRPSAVFHAAAHKHVPLMEGNPCEAVTNNVMGTRNVVDAAVAVDVEYFVLVSTDKAVRPTNVMGATKRVAEHIVKDASTRSRGVFVSVRFGNVLGSRGSVVPTFVRQIQSGGPVTITHPEMRRFFMTIPEAVQLVLQAAAMGRNGELFMLDMGESVRVVDLAEDLIRLSGLEVGTDIEIRFTGARPGEKLFEEMFWGDEVAERTSHPKVLRARRMAVGPEIMPLVANLIQSACTNESEESIRAMLHALVPDFIPTTADELVVPTPTSGTPVQQHIVGADEHIPSAATLQRKIDRRRSGRAAIPSGEHEAMAD